MPEAAARTGGPEGVMRVFVREPDRMLSSIDPSPFFERDLDEAAERFIVSWARDLPAGAPLCLEVEIADCAPPPDGGGELAEAVHQHFARRSETARRELRELMRRGRVSLAIGLVFLSLCVIAADLAGGIVHSPRLAEIVREGLNVAGWVAMWRPMEVFLYAWWPLAGDRRLYDRLSEMPVTVRCGSDGPPRVRAADVPGLGASGSR